MNIIKFKKSELVDSLDIDDNMLEAMSRMQSQSINLMVFISKDRTRMHGCLQMSDLLTYITGHWKQEVDCFKIPLKNLDMLF